MRQVLVLAMGSLVVLGACAGGPGPTTPAPASPSATAGVSTPTPAAAPASATARASRSPRPTPTLAPGVTRVFDLPIRPSGIAAGTDAIWLEDHAQTNRVYAIDPETGSTRTTINVTRPCDVVAAFDRIWVADLAAGRLLSIDPGTGTVARTVSDLAGPCGVQPGVGAIWLAVDSGLARVDPATGKVTIKELGGAAFPGAGTPLWAARFDSGELMRVDATSGDIELTIPPPGGRVEAPPVAAGFGAVWFGNASTRRVYRLDPMTGAIEAEIATSPPTRLLVTADAVWLTSYDEGVVERIDPEGNEVVFRAKLGGNINGITEGFGAIWVSDTGAGRIYRIDPNASGV